MKTRATETETEITVRVPKSKLNKLKAFLKEEKLKVKRAELPNDAAQTNKSSGNGFIKGNYKPGEQPGDAAGIWENDDRDENEIRRAAWHNRGINW